MSKLNQLPVFELVSLLGSGDIEARDILDSCIARIEAREQEVQAFEFFDPDRVRLELTNLSAEQRAGPLAGIPFGVKDIMDTHDMPTTWGSPVYDGFRPPRDAGCVATLRSLGAIAAGKTVTTEFAYFFPGKTRNPRNLAHTPGGSSQGSAAAVADAMLPFALGSQTAASVIRPAAFCGVVGYKASRGDFDLGGVCALSQSMDSLGFFVRDARDLALIRNAMNHQTDAEPVRRPARVGLVPTAHWPEACEATRTIVERVAAKIGAEGIEVEPIEVGGADGDLTEAQKTVMAFEVARARSFEYDHHFDEISPQIRALIEDGRGITESDYRAAARLALDWAARLATVFESVDFLITPSAPGEAPEGLGATGDPLFSRMWNLLGVPSITLPAGEGAQGLPIGVQMIGAYRQDSKLIADACWVQQVIG